MLRWLPALFLLALGTPVNAGEPAPPAASEGAAKDEAPAKKAAVLDPVVLQKQKKARALRQRGMTLMQRGLLDLALDTLRQALEAYPAYPAVYNDIGSIFAQKGELDRAEIAFSKATELDVDYAAGWANLAETQRRLGKADAAISNFKQFLRLRPDDAEAFYALAVLYAQKKDRAAALWAMERYLERAGKEGARVEEVAKRKEALAESGVKPKDPLQLASLGKGEAKPGEEPVGPEEPGTPDAAPEEAPLALGEPGQLPPHPGDELFAAKRYGDAREAYLTALEGAEEDVVLIYKIGATYAVMGDFRLAQRWWTRALSLEPGRQLIVRHMGLLAKKMAGKGQLDLAAPEGGVEAARKALVEGRPAEAMALLAGNEDREAVYLRGEAALRLGQLELAKTSFSTVLGWDAKDTAAQGGLAEALVRMKAGAEADTAMDAWLGDRLALPEDFLVLRDGEAAARIKYGPSQGGSDDFEDEW